MDFVKKYYLVILSGAFFLTAFFLTINIPYSADIWFHLRSGEIVSKLGIIHYDVFGHHTQGREWFAYEWLFQVSVYFIESVFGLEAVRIFTGLVVVTMLGLYFLILRKILNLGQLMSLAFTFIFFVSFFEFILPAPLI